MHKIREAAKVNQPHVFIQGSISFLRSVLALLPSDLCKTTSVLLDHTTLPADVSGSLGTSFPDFYWRDLSHRAFAGVTNGIWSFGSTLDFRPHGGIPRSKIKRTIKDVLVETEYGRPLSSLSDTASAVPYTGRIPASTTSLDVIANCCFIKGDDRRVLRPITTLELMSSYDLEVSSQKSLFSFWSSSKTKPSRAFALQAPLKILVGAARRILPVAFASLPTPPTIASPPSQNAAVAVPVISLPGEIPPPTPPADPSGSTSSPPQSDTFGMEADAPPAFSEGAVKAAKRDDAEVNVLDWDTWTVDSYLPSSDGNRPKICIAGTYGPAHKRLFAFMRDLMHRKYKRRLLRGFLKYLHVEHGGGGSVSVPHKGRDVTNTKVPWSVSYSHTRGGRRSIHRTVSVSPWCISPLVGKSSKKRCSSRRSRNDDFVRDLNRGRDCIERANNSTFWEWCDGSSIFFWRWPSRYKRALRDGTKLFVNRRDLPKFTNKQRLPRDPETRKKLLDKLQVPRGKRYITMGEVISRTGYFDVPKGEGDIRIVYDATACDAETFYGDIDLGEMFLNYALDEAIRPYAGVDVSALEPEKIKQGMIEVVERWERTLMGLRSSPYVCTQTFSWSEEIIRGERLAKNNPLRWDRVILNLPGDKAYDPSKPWVYRWNDVTGAIAGSFGTYVDDIRTQNHSERSCRATTRTVAAGVGYLGQQDAPRKRRPPTQRPGAWSGAMCFSKADEGLYVTCSQEKWNKGKGLVEELYQRVVVDGDTEVDRSSLEKGVGFLVHLSRTFPALFPYFKGIYLSMESWREGRNADGWKFSRKAWWNLMAGAFENDDENEGFDPKLSFEENKRRYLSKHQEEMPEKVKIVKRLSRDLRALRKLFDHDTPPKRLVCGTKIQEAMYGFGDASGAGFGASWEEKDGKIKFRAGTWGSVGDGSSSNWRELKNLVYSLKEMSKGGKLVGTEAFIFTDNSTAENAFFKGTSASPKLFDLLLELRELEMSSCCKIHLVHVAGTRMIAQGSDGLSRGNFTEGSMKGKSIFEYIPLGLSALDRSTTLRSWLNDWMHDLEFLDPDGWFERGHDLVPGGDRNVEGHWIPKYKSGNFVWTPPPAAAEAAVEELRKARHKRQDSTHIFVVPRLMKPWWHKQLCKASDIVLTLPAGHPAWPENMHEPLTIGLGNSNEHQDCWTWQASCRQCGKGTQAPKDIFCSNFGISRGTFPVCRRSWHGGCYRACIEVQFHIAENENDQGLIWKKEKDKDRFLTARNGDILGVPFQCDFCWFLNLKKRLPSNVSFEDQRLLSYIRRVNLDLFWCRESSTVADTLSNLRKAKRMSLMLGLPSTPFVLGPWPIGDNQGFQVALEMIRASQEVGKNVSNYQQFDTIRKIRTAYANVYERSPENALSSITFRPPQGNPVYFSNSPLTSVFFRRFLRGLEKRMGRVVFQDMALDVRVLIVALDIMEKEIRDPDVDKFRTRDLIVAGASFVGLYAGALRGPEILLTESMELCKRILDGKGDERQCHVYLPLMGRFKMENGDRNILMVFASESEHSKIPIRLWIENLASLLIEEGKDKVVGPAICESDGTAEQDLQRNSQ